MTDAVAETPVSETPAENSVPSNEATPEVTEPEFTREDLAAIDPDGFLGILTDKLTGVINKANPVKTRLNQIGGDVKAFTEATIESDQGSMPQYRQALQQLADKVKEIEDKRNAEVQALFEQSKEASKDEIAALQKEWDTYSAQIAAARKHLSVEAGENSAKVLSLLPKVVGSHGNTGARTGMNEGGRKLRNFELKVDGEVATLNGKSSFSAAASKIGVMANVVQDAYFAKIGMPNDTPAANLPSGVVEFEVENNGKTYTVSAEKLA
jgi:hypothetical protein